MCQNGFSFEEERYKDFMDIDSYKIGEIVYPLIIFSSPL